MISNPKRDWTNHSDRYKNTSISTYSKYTLSILKILVRTQRLRKMYRKARKMCCIKDTLRVHQVWYLRRRRKPNHPPSPATKMRQGGVKMIKNRNWQLIKISQRDFLCTLTHGGRLHRGARLTTQGGWWPHLTFTLPPVRAHLRIK